jgi:hypothetical protein
MLTGKSFRLKREILAIETIEESRDRRAIYVPVGAMITVESGPHPDDQRLVDVRWSDKNLVVFSEDLTSRGEPVASRSSGACNA